jgi:hypothetical protein
MAVSLSASYARKFRTIRGFPSESKLVTRMFHPAGILTVERFGFAQRALPKQFSSTHLSHRALQLTRQGH